MNSELTRGDPYDTRVWPGNDTGVTRGRHGGHYWHSEDSQGPKTLGAQLRITLATPHAATAKRGTRGSHYTATWQADHDVHQKIMWHYAPHAPLQSTY